MRTDEESDYCQRCRTLDFRRNAFELSKGGVIPLGTLVQWDICCLACSTFARLAGVVDLQEAQAVVAEDAIGLAYDNSLEDFHIPSPSDGMILDEVHEYCVLSFNTSTLFAEPPIPCLTSWSEPVGLAVIEARVIQSDDAEQIFNCIRGRGWLGSIGGSAARERFSPRSARPFVDAELAVQWIARCDAAHPACSPTLLRSTSKYKLIDCHSREVIESEGEHKFVTLSYVYAEAPDYGYLNGQLVNDQPDLIEDVIGLTVALGFRYLWIDRYCIDQADTLEKATQIQQMDQIYARSDITIIATKAINGLPGIRPRQVSDTITLSGETFTVVPPTPRYEIENSTWNDRAWCYQESVLSRRQLVILEGHILFKCPSMYCWEALHSPLHEDLSPAKERMRWAESEVFIPLSERADPLAHTLNHIAEYTKRLLSYPEDVLNAIRGVMARMALLYPDMVDVFGLPVVSRRIGSRTREEEFLTALCWKTAFLKIERRAGFPSWSWIGWYQSLPLIEDEEPDVEDTFGVSLMFEVTGHEPRSLSTVMDACKQNVSLNAAMGCCIIIEAPVLQVRYKGCTTTEREGKSLPHGRAGFDLIELNLAIRARYFPPPSKWDELPDPGLRWVAIFVGQRAERQDAPNSRMLIAITCIPDTDGLLKRCGIMEFDAGEYGIQQATMDGLRRKVRIH